LIFKLKESPFFLARKQRYEECIETLNYIAELNRTDPLDVEEEEIVRSTAP